MAAVDVSIIIPCYNEGPTFGHSVEEIHRILKRLRLKWEIVFVEDKSTDDTKRKLLEITKKIKPSKLILHKKNTGRGRSVSDGILASRGAICGYLDVDLEVSAKYIPVFISEIKKGAEMVVGKRFYETGGFNSVVRAVFSRIYSFIVKLFLDLPIEDTEAGYKFFKRKSIIPVLSTVEDKKWFWDTEICARAYWSKLNLKQIPVLFVKRPEKKSTVKLFSDSCVYFVSIFKFWMKKKELIKT